MGARGCRGQAGTGAGPVAVVTARPVPAPRGVASWFLGQGPREGLCKRGGKLQKAQTSESLFLESSDCMSAACISDCIRALPVLPWHFSDMEEEAALLNSASLRCFGLFYPDFLFVCTDQGSCCTVCSYCHRFFNYLTFSQTPRCSGSKPAFLDFHQELQWDKVVIFCSRE